MTRKIRCGDTVAIDPGGGARKINLRPSEAVTTAARQMSHFKRLIGLASVAVLLAAGFVLAAAIESADAKGSVRTGSGRISSPTRPMLHKPTMGKPVVRPGGNIKYPMGKPVIRPGGGIKYPMGKPVIRPGGGIKYPVIVKPGGYPVRHRHKHRFAFRFSTWIDRPVYCDCRYRICRTLIGCKTICSTAPYCPVQRPVIVAPYAISPYAYPFIWMDD